MDLIDTLKNKAMKHKGIRESEALELFIEGCAAPWRVFAAASEIRERFKGKEIILCSITNAKSGRCSEDCSFCAQSSHHNASAPVYPLKPAGQIVAEAAQAGKDGAEFFSIVTSGKSIRSKKEWSEILKAVGRIRDMGLHPCASLGLLDKDRAREVKDAGLFRYHHNLETARSYYSNICTTHDYEEKAATIRAAKEAGLSVCAGALFGMGENITHRIELAADLRRLDVDSVPINLLHPIKGTPLSHMPLLPPMEILMTLAVYRFLLPDRDIKLCGGKEKSLRQLLPLGIIAGANSLMTGNYLTTNGRDSRLDHEMIADLGLVPTRPQDICKCGTEEKSLRRAGKTAKKKPTRK
jgi:biotin synthase